MITNRYNSKCNSCFKPLAAGEGFAYKNGYRWSTCCTSKACINRLGLTLPENQIDAPAIAPHLTLDGYIVMPYSPQAVALVKSIPGARWEPETKRWKVSLQPEHRARLLEVAKQVGLSIPESLDQEVETEEMIKLKEVTSKLPLFPFQIEGAKFLTLHKRALLADEMGVGKALVHGTPVLTPEGWVNIEDIHVGDLVIGRNGLPTKVTGVFPQGKLQVYEVVFSDDRSVKCCKDHLWSVQTANDRFRNPNKLRTHSTEFIKQAGLFDLNKNSKWFMPMVSPVQFSEKEFKIHPYVIGALIANGSLDRSVCHHGTEEQRNRLIEFGISFKKRKEWTYAITNKTKLIAELKALSLFGTTCYNKFIPKQYLFGSQEQRLHLLQGLIDNDGTVSSNGMVVEYNTASEQLSLDVCELVRSLGGTATVSTRLPTYTYKGEKLIGSTDYRCRIKLPPEMCPVSIPHKVDRFTANTKYPPVISIQSIINAGEADCTCISVEASDSLYVVKDYIVTHNTLQAIAATPIERGVIVICPATLKYNWVNEFKRWRPDFKTVVLSGRDSFKEPEPGEVVIINYDILPASFTDEVAELDDVTLILDEAHLCKNYKTARSKKVANLARACKRVWMLTATPLLNRPTDLFGLLCAGNMNVFGTWNKFLGYFNGYKNRFGGYEFGDPQPIVPELMKRIMLRRLKKDVLKDLPPKIYKDILVNDISDKDRAVLDGVIHKGLVSQGLAKNTSEAKENSETLSELFDVTSLPGFSEFAAMRALLAKIKIPAMLEVVESYEESDEPLVVFSAHRAPIDILAEREGWAVITGDTTIENRQRIVEEFQAGKLKGVGLTIKAGGVGITLTRSSNVLFVDLDWTPALNIQAEDRCHRIGTTGDNVLITRLVSKHPLDVHIHNLLSLKIELARSSLDKSMNVEKVKAKPAISAQQLIDESEDELRARLSEDEDAEKKAFALHRLRQIGDREFAKVKDIPQPELTDDRKGMLLDALDHMLGQCDGAETRDGVGFSKPDAGIARWIAASSFEDDFSYRILERILVRYRRQLKGMFEEIWRPAV